VTTRSIVYKKRRVDTTRGDTQTRSTNDGGSNARQNDNRVQKKIGVSRITHTEKRRRRRDSYRPAERERVQNRKTSFPAHTTAIDGSGDRVRVTGGGKKEGVPTVVLANPRRSSLWCTNIYYITHQFKKY
jgi:hypothetical protein